MSPIVILWLFSLFTIVSGFTFAALVLVADSFDEWRESRRPAWVSARLASIR